MPTSLLPEVDYVHGGAKWMGLDTRKASGGYFRTGDEISIMVPCGPALHRRRADLLALPPSCAGCGRIVNITAKRGADGSVAIQFGGCDGKILNCPPVEKGWNYMVRLYRPRAAILNGTWKFPEAQPVN